MDYFIPGCPPEADAIFAVLDDVINDRPVDAAPLPESLRLAGGSRVSRKLVIDPVTRIEGHGKVTVHLDDDSKVVDARLHVVEFRGFEKFIQGHPYWEAPVLMQRICGICFVSHHLSGAKALDDIIGVGADAGSRDPTAEKMRRLGHYAQMLQSHVTAYFYLVVPEMMFGMDAPPDQRNVLGLIEANPELIERVVMLRKWGQEVIKAVFGRRMHGISSVPGGVNKGLAPPSAIGSSMVRKDFRR